MVEKSEGEAVKVVDMSSNGESVLEDVGMSSAGDGAVINGIGWSRQGQGWRILKKVEAEHEGFVQGNNWL